MERSLLLIALLVFAVGFVGFLTLSRPIDVASETLSGRAITEMDPCDACMGSPVCAAHNGKVANYPSRCDAVCNGARVIYDGVCERIPRVRDE
jgi:hypothetical protein